MAKYGIDRALLAADRPETDQPADRILNIDNPWAREKAHLLSGLASALRCQCILLGGNRPGSKVHLFGFTSDIDRTDVLYTSILIQMAHGLAGAQVPEWSSSPRAWRRSWLLGFATAVIARVREAVGAGPAQQRYEDRVGAMPVRPELGVPGVRLAAAEVRHLGQQGRAIQHSDVLPASQDVIENVPGLGQMRRASDVGHDAAWPGRLDRRVKQRPLQLAERGDVCRIPPPPRLGPAPEAAEPGARNVG